MCIVTNSMITSVLDELRSDLVGHTMILLQNPLFDELHQESVNEEKKEEEKSIRIVLL